MKIDLNPDIQKQLVSLIESARQAGSDASDFIAKQAPDVIEQYIRWQITSGIIDVVAGCIGLLALIWSGRWLWKADKIDSFDKEGLWLAYIFGGGTLGVICIVAIYSGATDAIQAIVAPKTVILELVTKHLTK